MRHANDWWRRHRLRAQRHGRGIGGLRLGRFPLRRTVELSTATTLASAEAKVAQFDHVATLLARASALAGWE
jgi:hypothetical protein